MAFISWTLDQGWVNHEDFIDDLQGEFPSVAVEREMELMDAWIRKKMDEDDNFHMPRSPEGFVRRWIARTATAAPFFRNNGQQERSYDRESWAWQKYERWKLLPDDSQRRQYGHVYERMPPHIQDTMNFLEQEYDWTPEMILAQKGGSYLGHVLRASLPELPALPPGA